jgi:uncharacterized protein (DUF2235 family)
MTPATDERSSTRGDRTVAKNIVICCDGTNNKFGLCNTNVVRLTQVAEQDAATQLVYYDPGVGTLPELGALTAFEKRLSEVKALAFGTDVETKVGTAYAHLMEVWQPGDLVFLFGFSRGAYTARVLAALLHSLGLLPPGNTHLIPYVLRIFASLRGQPPDSSEYWKLSNSFRWTFARPIPERDDRRLAVHFLGVWDTVASVGWIWNPASYPYTHSNPSVKIVRHAVSIDERRWFFRQNLFGQVAEQDAKERWFAGVHSDIGGGYPEEDGGLWRVTFEWMLKEAREKGLRVDLSRLDRVRTRTPIPNDPWAEPKHESLEGAMWSIAEFVPKRVYDPTTKKLKWGIGARGFRVVQDGAELDASALHRLRAGSYAPGNLDEGFVAIVRGLASVPDQMTLHADH